MESDMWLCLMALTPLRQGVTCSSPVSHREIDGQLHPVPLCLIISEGGRVPLAAVWPKRDQVPQRYGSKANADPGGLALQHSKRCCSVHRAQVLAAIKIQMFTLPVLLDTARFTGCACSVQTDAGSRNAYSGVE